MLSQASAWQAAAIALAIGLLIGSERERTGALAGVRTFALAGLGGALAAMIHPLALAGLVAGAAVVVAGSLFVTSDKDPGITTEVALVLTVVLGGLTVTYPALAAGAGVATASLLLAKERLHAFVRDKITELEVGDALKFFVAAFIVLPLTPHASLGPYGVIDLRRIWTFVVAVTALGWLGYVAVRLLGPRRGLPVAGLAGGFVSGAATTGAMARTSRDPRLFRPAMAAALLASLATLVQLVLVTAVADRRVAVLLLPAAGLGSLVLVAEAGWLVLRPGRLRSPGTPAPGTPASGTPATGTAATGTPAATPLPTPPGPAGSNPVVTGTITGIHFGDAPPPSWEIPVPRSPYPLDTSDYGFPPPPTVRAALAPRGRPKPPPEASPLLVDADAPSAADPNPSGPPVAGAAAGDPEAAPALVGRRPFALIPALILAGILTLFLVIAAVAEHQLGTGAAVLAIATAGLADAHAGALTAAGLAAQGSLAPETAVLAAMAAVGVNTVVKLVLAHAAGGRRASTTLAALFAAPVLAVAVGLLLTLGLT